MMCPTCGAELRALFTSVYCPMDVPGIGHGATITVAGCVWRAQRVRYDEVIPSWATRGWHLRPLGTLEHNANSELGKAQLLKIMKAHFERESHEKDVGRGNPGWILKGKYVPGTKFNSDECQLMAFGLLATGKPP